MAKGSPLLGCGIGLLALALAPPFKTHADNIQLNLQSVISYTSDLSLTITAPCLPEEETGAMAVDSSEELRDASCFHCVWLISATSCSAGALNSSNNVTLWAVMAGGILNRAMGFLPRAVTRSWIALRSSGDLCGYMAC